MNKKLVEYLMADLFFCLLSSCFLPADSYQETETLSVSSSLVLLVVIYIGRAARLQSNSGFYIIAASSSCDVFPRADFWRSNLRGENLKRKEFKSFSPPFLFFHGISDCREVFCLFVFSINEIKKKSLL